MSISNDNLRSGLNCRVMLFSILIGLNYFNAEAQIQGTPSSLPDVKYHLTSKPWQPLNISRDAYLDKVEGIVREIAKFQDSNGAIIDPYEHTEVQYSTPYFANALGTLISTGRAMDLLNAGIAAMNNATAAVATGISSSTFTHGEFFLAPLSTAISLYQPYVPVSVAQAWKDRMATPLANILKGNTNNWRTYAMKGEWYRVINNSVNKDTAINWIENSWFSSQRDRFTDNLWNFYHDGTNDPDTWPYESAARSNLLALIRDGYDGPSKTEMLSLLKRGTQSSLLAQDPSGQGVAGGRSGNHTWNDIVLANGFETAAEIARSEGNLRLAGQYRRAAALGFQSAQRFIRSDGTYSITKNQFNPAQRIRYARYSFFTNYNAYMMYHMAENYLRHTSNIPEAPAPNEIGGYTLVTDDNLATAFANAGGMQMQACLRGSTSPTYNDVYWTMLGVVRFGKAGWDSRLGPSDGTRETSSGLGISFAPTFLENGQWVRLASMPDRYEAIFTTHFAHPLLVRCQVEYRPKAAQTGPTFTNNFIITPDGILSKLTSTGGDFGVTWPVLTYDGATNLNTQYTSHIASTSFPSGTDEQNFIAMHKSPVITSNITVKRSSYGDLNPARMVSDTAENVTFIYPRTSADPSSESVRLSYTHSRNNFSTAVGRVTGNTYVGRYSAGGEGTGIDLDNDGAKDVTFSSTCGFLIQLDKGAITNIEVDRNVSANIAGQIINLTAYTPYAYSSLVKSPIAAVVASSNDGNLPINTIDGDLNTRWSAVGNQWIRYFVDTTILLKSVNVAWYKGDERKYNFEIEASNDGISWGTIFSGVSSSTTTGLESYDTRDTTARYVRIYVHGNNVNNWSSITELELLAASQVYNTTGKSILFTNSTDSSEVAQGEVGSILEYISTSDNNPTSVLITAVDASGNTPTWLSVNGMAMHGVNYTTGSELSLDIDATNLSLGSYSATVTASAPGYNSATLNIFLTVKLGSSGTLSNIKINFQDSITVPPAGWIRDYGQAFGQRLSAYQGSGNVYGWIKRSDNTPLNLTKNGRNRSIPPDILLSTLMHMQAGDAPSASLTGTEGIWEVQVANGDYDVTVSAGDGSYTNSKHAINVEGVNAISNFFPTSSELFRSTTVTVSVADGLLTIDPIGGTNTKINYVIIQPSASKRPSVVLLNPENRSQNVSENISISTSILNLPNGGIDNSTLTSSSVFLTEDETGIIVPSNVNGTGGGDAITLVPASPLKLSATYNFNITDKVKDLTGASFIPYVSQFTIGSGSSSGLASAWFEKIALPNTVGRHSSLTIGPDGKLYALSIDGLIKRFPVNNDGTLGDPDTLYSLQDHYAPREQRLAIGFAFDPSATAGNLVAWATNSSFVFLNGPSWDGKLTKLSGNNLQNVQDVLINLPRSSKDHVTNSIAFGPDGKLYFTQGSTSAMGRADHTWGNREECLLSGALLRLDVSKLGALPLDVKTPDGGGIYNPYAPNAPVTIFASGLRNAYDLVWHSNGKLYVPTNGSAAGGNTPLSVAGTLRPDGSTYNGPLIPALTNVQQTQKDFLFKVDQGGYYGHPNALRGEYVMNGGNPTASIDPAQVNDYPVGTMPDTNWRGYSFDFQSNKSPNGVIEYRSNTFNGALKGKILVVRYSQNDDIITLTPGGPANDIVSSTEGAYIEGFSGFIDPLDLTEDTTRGNIYVSEYGGNGKITLLRPKTDTLAGGPALVLNAIADATIRDGGYSNKSYGDDTSLLIKSSPNSGFSRASYLKFSLSDVKTISSAKLRLYGSNTVDRLGITISCYGVDTDAWAENTISWNNAPVPFTAPMSSSVVSGQLKYYEFDVSDYVKSQFAGDKIVSLVLKDPVNTDKILSFNSKENPQNRPQLVILTGIDTSVSTKNTTATVGPLADASVRDGTYANKNYGDDTTFLVKTSPNSGFSRIGYLKFSLSNINSVSTVKLRVYGSNTSDNSAISISCYGVDADSWLENSLTWNNAPAYQASSLSFSLVSDQRQYYEFDVTDYVKNQYNGDKIASFVLRDPSNSDKVLSFNSKENKQNRPQLYVTSLGASNIIMVPATTVSTQEGAIDKNTGLFSMEEIGESKNDFETPRIYPNPLNGKFNLEFPTAYFGNYTIQIVDVNGRRYEIAKVGLRAGGSNMEINISKLKLNPGIYYLQIRAENGKTEIIKIMIV